MSRWFYLVLPIAAGCVAFRPSDAPEPIEPPDPLALAAEALDRGDDRTAGLQLSTHLNDHPEDAATRLQYAELLHRLQRPSEAREEYLAFVSVAQCADGPIRRQLPHVHTKLMLIAQDANDSASEQLHRGIGLFELVAQWDAERLDGTLVEPTLTKAARALRLARSGHPGRANLYLALVYERLGQLSAARSAARAALAAAPFDFTPWERERRDLWAEQ
jgi:tetratricopeptide (TPR) repeat protein